MCDFSLQAFNSRPAKVADKLITKNFGTGTRGFADPSDLTTAVCVLPGTEIAFDADITKVTTSWLFNESSFAHKTAIFRQIDTDKVATHHDCLELPDGKRVLLTHLEEGQTATILQLPAAPRNEQEAKEQTRLEVVA